MGLNTISSCRSCGSPKVEKFLDLGRQPFANAFLKSPQDRFKEKKYPLELAFCLSCSLVQLTYTADPKELFSNYLWVTGTSAMAQEYAKQFCEKVVDFTGPLESKDLVLEAASNDGTFLKEFARKGCRVLGVDPAENIAAMANQKGVPTECAFFGRETARKIADQQGPAKVLYARNVLPHVASLHDFLGGLEIILDQKGVLVLEVHSAKAIFEELHYDSVYHEHLCYFSLKSLRELLKQFGFQIARVLESPISGGSLVVFAQKGLKKTDSSVAYYEASEERSGVNRLDQWMLFNKGVQEHKKKLLELLGEELESGRTIIGYGASARSSTLLNFCGIDGQYIKEIADQNRLKRKFYTPGTYIPIYLPEEVFDGRPSVTVLVLAWNFFKEIQALLKEKFLFSGDLICPLPNQPQRQ